LSELSVQLSLISVVEDALAKRFVGLAGIASSFFVIAFASLEYEEAPYEL